MKVDPEVLEVLSGCRIDSRARTVVLVGQLERKLYTKVNEVLEAVGGKWNRKAKAHVFESDPYELLDNVIVNGHVEVPKDDDFYPTPERLAEKLVTDAIANGQLNPEGAFGLEPSAGEGVIAQAMAREGMRVVCFELNEKRASVLRAKGFQTSTVDFLTMAPIPQFSYIVMNPPFSRSNDVKHVAHALRFLKDDGKLVSVMSAGVRFRRERLYQEFRDMVAERGGFFYDLPPNSFKESGTGVNAIVAVI